MIHVHDSRIWKITSFTTFSAMRGYSPPPRTFTSNWSPECSQHQVPRHGLSSSENRHLSTKLLPLLNSRTSAFDDMADIPNRDLEREVHRGEHLREEYPPPGHAGHEAKRPCCLYKSSSQPRHWMEADDSWARDLLSATSQPFECVPKRVASRNQSRQQR